MRSAFRDGREKIEITEEVFDLSEYNAFLQSIAPELEAFKQKQRAAFELEVAHWKTDEENTSKNGSVNNSAQVSILILFLVRFLALIRIYHL